ncbi:MAG: hypothetical protein QF408_14240 [Pirellulales bacterium]|jgi:hypothetical protein|nr:hypothetical protein [Pirellulales bacterium]
MLFFLILFPIGSRSEGVELRWMIAPAQRTPVSEMLDDKPEEFGRLIVFFLLRAMDR